MIKVLKDIYSDVGLGNNLGFKGGTALYFFHNLSRFSVDLDFDLLDNKKKDFVFKKVGDIVKKYGEVREERDKNFNLIWILSYKKGARQLKIQINKRGTNSAYEVKSFMGISVKIMVASDMFAHKLEALLTRKRLANRDIFDVWFMLEKYWDINWDILGLKNTSEKKKYLHSCISLLEKPIKDPLEGMGELLESESQKDWVRNKLIEETIFQLKLRQKYV